MTTADPSDRHEWLSVDVDDVTYLFDLTFLTSNWSCIYGQGCQGVLTGPAPELVHGCCTYGAHFVDKADRKKIAAIAETLDADHWQYRAKAEKLGGPIHKNEHGEWVTRTHKGACIFLNRPGFGAGAGCAFHQVALQRGERPLDLKPTVCWQLPLRLEESTDASGRTTLTLREWKRRDWGEGGFEFHWWCTDDPEAFVGAEPVVDHLRDEIIEMVGLGPYEALVEALATRSGARPGQPAEQWLPHPALKKRP
jgi:hypothetical protein